jgi:hypothetical protein
MIPKYTIEYSINLRKHAQTAHFSTDDPVACEQAMVEFLDRGFGIRSVKHEGVDLPRPEFDKVIRGAANLLASNKISASLGLKAEEERFRFGFAA